MKSYWLFLSSFAFILYTFVNSLLWVYSVTGYNAPSDGTRKGVEAGESATLSVPKGYAFVPNDMQGDIAGDE